MKTRLQILLIEDAVADAELIARELKASGLAFALTRVESEQEFRQELALHPPHLVLSDHGLPALNGFRALAIARTERPGLPFIFVSGSNDPSMVAQMYEEGATDYVFKQDMADLKVAVLAALETQAGLWPMSAGEEPPPVQSELDLELHPAISPAGSPSPVGHLSFCPKCLRVRDETGAKTAVENYYSQHSESVVVREMCPDCAGWGLSH